MNLFSALEAVKLSPLTDNRFRYIRYLSAATFKALGFLGGHFPTDFCLLPFAFFSGLQNP